LALSVVPEDDFSSIPLLEEKQYANKITSVSIVFKPSIYNPSGNYHIITTKDPRTIKYTTHTLSPTFPLQSEMSDSHLQVVPRSPTNMSHTIPES